MREELKNWERKAIKMAGGTWKKQNKRQPGVYINVRSDMDPVTKLGERGVVAICEPLPWGPEGTITALGPDDDCTPYIGYGNNDTQALFLREIFKGSDRTSGPGQVLLYRLSGKDASRATAASDIINATAKYNGTRGNDIRITISASGKNHTVQTMVGTEIKDTQEVQSAGELKGNDWVEFGDGTLAESAGIPLTGGKDGTMDVSSYEAFLDALEGYTFNVLIYDGADDAVQSAYAGFIEHMRESIGKKCQAVMADIDGMDSEAVISVRNGVRLSDGTVITPQQATWWVGGSEAGASYNESLVYAQYPDAVDASPVLTSAQIDDALAAGQIVFFREFGTVKVVSDINTMVTFSDEKGEVFSLNQVIRTVDTVANDVYRHFSTNVIGKVQNDDASRDLIKTWIVGYLNEMQADGGIRNFSADDVTVGAGEAINAVVVSIAIQPVTAIEKIYVTVSLTNE